MDKRLMLIISLIILVLLAVFVWPTKYKYTTMDMGSREVPVRIDRFSGDAEFFYPGRGWVGTEE